MILADPPVRLQRLSEQRVGGREVAIQPQDRRETTHADGRFPVLVPVHFPPDGQGFTLKRLGARVESLILVNPSELDECHGDIRVLRAEQLAPHAERLFEAASGGRIVAHFRQQDSQVVEILGQTFVLRAEDRPSDGERLFEKRPGLVVDAQPPIDPSHHRQDLGLHFGLSGELFLHPLGAGVEQPSDGRLSTHLTGHIRIGAGQQPGQQLAHLGGFLRLQPRAVALCREPGRVEPRQAAEQQDDDSSRRHAAHVPPYERGGPIAQRVRPRADRLVA